MPGDQLMPPVRAFEPPPLDRVRSCFRHGGYTPQGLLAAARFPDLDLAVPIHRLAGWMPGGVNAAEEAPGLYLWFQTRHRPRVGPCGILVDSLDVREFEETPVWPGECGEPGASEMLAVAEY